MEHDWDAPVFDPFEVARIARIPDVKTVVNWIRRGLVNPYNDLIWKPRRGRARRYSLRNVLMFAGIQDLVRRYAIPVPLGRRIFAALCQDFTPTNIGYVVIENIQADTIRTKVFPTAKELTDYLSSAAMTSCLVLDTRTLSAVVKTEAEKVFADHGAIAAKNSLSTAERAKSAAALSSATALPERLS